MCLLLAGVRESTRANTVLVLTKLLILVFFIVIGITHFTGHHFKPFAPHGTSGTVDAAALIFFAYIGFDAVSTTGEEADNPQRDLPIGIIGSLVLVTIVYILVAVAAIGLVPTNVLDGADAPLTEAIRQGAGLGDWAGDIMSFGALIAITSVVLTIYYGQTRIFFSMCRDGLVPARQVAEQAVAAQRADPDHAPVRDPDRDHGRVDPAVGACRAREHRDPLRVPAGQHRRDRPAPAGAGHGAPVPRAVRPARSR